MNSPTTTMTIKWAYLTTTNQYKMGISQQGHRKALRRLSIGGASYYL